jgi:hypothetical protein
MRNFTFTRDKQIRMLEEFDEERALKLAIEFKDIENATRLSVKSKRYNDLYTLFDDFPGIERQLNLHKSMEWIIKNHQELLRRKKNTSILPKLQLFDIFEERYENDLEAFIEKYPNLKLIFYMRKGQFQEIRNECKNLQEKYDGNMIKSVTKSIEEVNTL